jgi:hypothetical protein
MYSLTNIATVVRDVARHERATQIVADLLLAFALDSQALGRLDRLPRAPGQQIRRDRLVHAERRRPGALELLAATRSAADRHGLAAYSAALPALEAAPMFGLDELMAFVRDEVLEDAWLRVGDLSIARWPTAIEIVADGLAGSWSGDPLLGAAWRQWIDAAGTADAAAAPATLLAAVATFARNRSDPVVPAEWASRMHEACWAVQLTGRARVAAVTQLKALREVLQAWAPDRPPLAVVATVTAAVHAHVVADILPTATHHAMTKPVHSLLA